MPPENLIEGAALLAGAIIAVETAVSLAVIRRRGGPSAFGVVCNAVAGLALMGAVVMAARDASPFVILALVTLSGVAHLGETFARWSRR